MFQGRGRLIKVDGDIYEGEFKNNKTSGKVIVILIYRELFTALTVSNMMVNGKMMLKMVMALKHGVMDLYMRVIIKMDSRTDKEHLNGLMDQSTLENLLMEILKEKVNSSGKTVEFILANGRIIKWMVKG